jgi:hypothetical protein
LKGEIEMKNKLFDEKLYDELKEERTFKQFQATRVEVRAPYMGERGEDPSGTPAMVYLNSLDKYIGESLHIGIDPSDFNGEPIANEGGKKYYLILENAEYNSNKLEELEKLLFEWIQEK